MLTTSVDRIDPTDFTKMGQVVRSCGAKKLAIVAIFRFFLPETSKFHRLVWNLACSWKSAFLQERGQFGPKFQVQGVVPRNHSSCQKARMIDLSYTIKMWVEVSFVFNALHRMQMQSSDENSVLPSVSLSHACIVTKR